MMRLRNGRGKIKVFLAEGLEWKTMRGLFGELLLKACPFRMTPILSLAMITRVSLVNVLMFRI